MDKMESRRKFLKKAAYAAPVVLALGGLAAQADSHGSKLGSSNAPKPPKPPKPPKRQLKDNNGN